MNGDPAPARLPVKSGSGPGLGKAQVERTLPESGCTSRAELPGRTFPPHRYRDPERGHGNVRCPSRRERAVFGRDHIHGRLGQTLTSFFQEARSDKKINPPVAGVRSLIEPVARSEAAPGRFRPNASRSVGARAAVRSALAEGSQRALRKIMRSTHEAGQARGVLVALSRARWGLSEQQGEPVFEEARAPRQR